MTSGECLIPISIQGKEFTIKFLVTHQLRHSLILRLPWLETELAILNLTRHVLYVGHDTRVTIPLVRAPQQRKWAPLFNATMVKHGLASPQQETLLKLLQTHAEIFSPLCQGLPQTRTIQHEIRVTTDQPFRLPSYRYPEQKRAIIEEQIQQMLANGITEQTTSPYSSPIVLAQRKNK